MIARVPRFHATIDRLPGAADVQLNGPNPWDMQVKNERVFTRILAHGSLGLGESYLGGESFMTYATERHGVSMGMFEHVGIFPNAVLPSIEQIGSAIERRFVVEDWHNFGADCDRTLVAWFRKFDGNWPRIAARYGERFYRIWRYYLLSCAGGFRARVIQLWQRVLSKHGVPGGYLSVR